MATLYFNGAVDGDWNTLGNWWDDSGFTTPASALPTSSDSVIASATISSNSGSAPTVIDFTIGGGSYTIQLSSTILTVTGTATFNDSTSLLAQINGSVVFNDTSFNDNGVIVGNVVFNDSSYHDGTGTQYGITGNVTFNNNSYCIGPIDGNNITVTFNDSSILGVWDGTQGGYITGNAEFNDNSIKRGNVTGTITWNSTYHPDGDGLTYYFNGVVDNDWNNIGNWWLDSGFTVPITTLIGLPQNIDSVVASANITSNSGSEPTVANFTITDAEMRTNSNITNSAIFNGSSILAVPSGSIQMNMTDASATITFNNNSVHNGGINVFSNGGTGSVIFNDSSYINTGTINANTTFNDNSALGVSGNITGDVTFNDSSIKRGTITGTITWNSSYPNDYSLTYYYNNATTDGDWSNLNNWWLDESCTIPINGAIGLPDAGTVPQNQIDSVVILANVNTVSLGVSIETLAKCKNLTVGTSSVGNINFDINITVSYTVTFNNNSNFAYYGNKIIYIGNNVVVPTITFNNGSSIDGSIQPYLSATYNVPNIILNDSYVNEAALNNGANIAGNLTLNNYSSITFYSSLMTSSNNYIFNDNSQIFGLGNSGTYFNIPCQSMTFNDYSGESTYLFIGRFNCSNVVLNDNSFIDKRIDFAFSSLVFNDYSSYRSLGYNSESAFGSFWYDYGQGTNSYTFNDNSFNYGYIYTGENPPWNAGSTVIDNRSKGINGSSILGLV